MPGATESLSDAIARLVARGYTADLRASDGQLRDTGSGARFEPEGLEIAETVRFEGDSDPDEQAILFALRAPSGAQLGTFAVVYGPGMPAAEAEVVRRLGAKH